HPISQPISGNTVTGTINGFWGFDAFHGPTLQLQQTPGKDWKLAPDDVLIAGRENHLTLTSTGSACIDTITLDNAAGKRVETQWKPAAKPDAVNISLSLKSLDPGSLHLSVLQFGQSKADVVAAQTFSEPATLAALQLHADDITADLTGTSLDQVQKLAINGMEFSPTTASPDATTPDASNSTSLRLSLPQDAPAPKFKAGDKLTARFTLKDGRILFLPVTVAPPRPSVTLLSKSIGQASNSPIHLADQNDLPVDQQLTFSLKSSSPFPRTGKIEVANTDDTLHATLSVASGTLVLQNPHTLLATLDPLKTFGTSAFGPLRMRPVLPDGTPGDWLPLVTLVRLPTLKDLHCPPDTAQPCTLTGSSLYLVEAIATDADFTAPTTVPEGFIGTTLTLPRPGKSGFYLRLRDDPADANPVTLPVLTQKAPTAPPPAPPPPSEPGAPPSQ
ncbi:MAG TPA: hypothetical protein VK627_01455, partial [Edaphobacter sp.]|nr:hypothetical protein [Edaphobacter sp.]